MNRRITHVGILAFVWIGLFASGARSQTPKPADELNVLFIGNSLTSVNNLPKMVAELAKAGKQPALNYEAVTPGGCTLEKHWNDAKALEKIKSRKCDFVVLQEHSTGFAKQASMFEYGKKFDAEIKKQGAKTLLYLTWANSDKPENQAIISKAYLDLAKEIKAEVAPVGKAWDTALAADKKLTLHSADKKHPTPAGTYLAACVFYASIYGKSPEGLPGTVAKLSDEDAKTLQSIAWKIVEKKDK